MQINFNQAEIEQALKNYIVEQGIALYAKTVTLAFTAGRKAAGLSVEVNIEDDPAFTAKVSAEKVYTLPQEEAQVVDVPQGDAGFTAHSVPVPAIAVEGAEVLAKTTSLFA